MACGRRAAHGMRVTRGRRHAARGEGAWLPALLRWPPLSTSRAPATRAERCSSMPQPRCSCFACRPGPADACKCLPLPTARLWVRAGLAGRAQQRAVPGVLTTRAVGVDRAAPPCSVLPFATPLRCAAAMLLVRSATVRMLAPARPARRRFVRQEFGLRTEGSRLETETLFSRSEHRRSGWIPSEARAASPAEAQIGRLLLRAVRGEPGARSQLWPFHTRGTNIRAIWKLAL
eukprot:357076-Chlamydomonas_euryale.AAC.5